MLNSFGTNVNVTLFGESHGPLIGAVLDGLPAGFPIDLKLLDAHMDKRRAHDLWSTARKEKDLPELVSGFFEGRTTGSPLTILIRNENTRSKDYSALKSRLRPGHADFTAYQKYHGFQDYRGGGHFSGRLTAPLVAAGSVCRQLLASKGIEIGSHILQLYNVQDDPFSTKESQLQQQIRSLQAASFPALNSDRKEKMIETILQARSDLDSVGGIVQSAVYGLPAGLGEPFFDSVESVLAHLLFSIPGIKGVSFGAGFDFAGWKGSQANDPFILEQGTIKTKTNHNGGINGGISNGMPILIQCAIKPTPSIYKPQDSVDYESKEEVRLEIAGRHDPAIIHRACAVIDSLIAVGLLDLYLQCYGRESFQFPSKENFSE